MRIFYYRWNMPSLQLWLFTATSTSMPPKQKVNKSFKQAQLAAMANGISKAGPSDVIRNPANDVQEGVVDDDAMAYEGGFALLVNPRTSSDP